MKLIIPTNLLIAVLTLIGVAGSLALPVSAAKPDSNLVNTKPSKVYPLAAKSLLLDMTNTGEGLVAVGARGHVLRSEDGNNWVQVPVPVDSLLTALNFSDPQNGWAVGHDAAILHTNDGGASWSLQHFNPEGAGPLLDVIFESATTGYAVGAFGTFMSTTDGGKSWAPYDASAVVDAGVHLYSIERYQHGRWIVAGEMGFLAATNSEGDWEVLDSPYGGSFYSVAPVGKTGAIAVGMRGNAYVTRDIDAGEWQKLETQTQLGLTNVSRLPSGRYVITGLNRTLLVADTKTSKVRRVNVPGETAELNTGSYNAFVVKNMRAFVASDEGVKLVIGRKAEH